jgi:hypothetical protein
MKIGFRTFVVVSILLIVAGVIAISYLIEPTAFLFSQNSQASGLQVSNGTSAQSTNVTPIEIKSIATASYCNCTDTQTDDG